MIASNVCYAAAAVDLLNVVGRKIAGELIDVVLRIELASERALDQGARLILRQFGHGFVSFGWTEPLINMTGLVSPIAEARVVILERDANDSRGDADHPDA
jgi:hypothetical protein